MKSDNAKGAVSDDVLFHLEILLTDCEQLKIDYNRDPVIEYKIDKMAAKILMVMRLYHRQDKPSFRALKNKINNSISTKLNLKGIIVYIENSRCKDLNGTVEKFKIEV